MNRLNGFAAIMMTGLIVFTGCIKNDYNSTASNPGTMSAVIGGNTITATNCLESSDGATHIISASFGANSDITSIIFNLQVSKFTDTTYTFNGIDQIYNVGYTTSSGGTYFGISGSLTLTAVNPASSFTGSFNFTSVNGTVITGTFTAIAASTM